MDKPKPPDKIMDRPLPPEVFNNQPSFKVFNKSFTDTSDSLFVFLNEVDPVFLNEEQQKEGETFSSYECLFERQDPRTKEVIRQTEYDHTIEKLHYTFAQPKKRYSLIGRSDQAACLRVLLSFQTGSNASHADFVIWNRVQTKWITEQKLAATHFYDYGNIERERLYAPMKPLVQIYKLWFKERMQRLLKSLPNATYITHSGLPQLHQCKNLNVNTATMEQVELLFRTGYVRQWPEVKLNQQYLSTLRLRLERYVLAGVASDSPSQFVASELYSQLPDVEEDVFVLPLTALLLLLMPGAYVDLPTEMPLHIRENAGGRHKCFEFKETLPARNCGFHTNNQIVTEAYAAYAPDEWMQFTADGVKLFISDTVVDYADELRKPEYKLHPIDDEPYPVQKAKCNGALVSWRLKADPRDPAFLICSSLAIPAVRDDTDQKLLGCHFIKLENKPECGCEIMTKYELISAWLQMKLLKTNVGHCTRIALSDFVPLLEQKLTLDDVDKQLQDHYKVNMSQQLCQLHEFLKVLRRIPPGNYLLRYSPKYVDKFLLCYPTLEKTPQCFRLHDLLMEKPPSNLYFLTDPQSNLPIASYLVSRLHLELQLLPCAFLARARGMRPLPSDNKPPEMLQPTLIQRTMKKIKPKIKRKKNKKRKQEAKKTLKFTLKKQDAELEKFMCL